MEIIIEGHKIDTKDIWAVELEITTRKCAVIIKINDKPAIMISRSIPYGTRVGEFDRYWQPFEKLYKEVKSKWEADKSTIPVFKLDKI